VGIDSVDSSADLLVIGGGVNGVGVARDAAGRGLSVVLCEKDDIANHTSSSSTKLIHGGLRYLEHFDFKLVRHSLKEREVLLRSAPHIIWPMRFVLPHHRALRPRWLIRIGLYLYDHLSKRQILPGSTSIRLRSHPAGNALQDRFSHGFEYSDCWVQDARLVVLCAIDARQRGAQILTRTRCTSLVREPDDWRATLVQSDGEEGELRVRGIVNAAGPWVDEVSGLVKGSTPTHGVRLVKGSHIIVPSLFDHDYAYIFQNSDDRIMFAIPYESRFTLIGTTDVEVEGDPGAATISDSEIQYLCDNANRYFRSQIRPGDVAFTYSGIRPLFDDAARNASKTTRDYVLRLEADGPPLVSVYGGKITTYRRLAEDVMEMLAPALGVADVPWTMRSSLPGGDMEVDGFEAFRDRCLRHYPWADPAMIGRMARNYGTRIDQVLEGASAEADLGTHFGAGLYLREVQYLIDHEWAASVDDILSRRTKLGLHGGQALRDRLQSWFTDNRPLPGTR